jgi:RNA polymerase sigma factor (sigma-70 family)
LEQASTRARERALDGYLVASARLGDRKAFGLLAERWQAKLTAHAWRLLGDEEGAREAAQEAWTEIVCGLHRLRDARAFPAWAYRIVSRRCARLIGQARQRRRLAETMLAEPDIPAAETESASDIDRLRKAIRSLPAGQRAAVALFHLEEMSVAEVAVALGVPAGTVKTRLMHARKKLRDVLQGE